MYGGGREIIRGCLEAVCMRGEGGREIIRGCLEAVCVRGGDC